MAYVAVAAWAAMKRWRIKGRRGSWGDFDVEAIEYVSAENPDDAVRRARGILIDVIDEIREVPWDEGRGWFWRLCRWLKII